MDFQSLQFTGVAIRKTCRSEASKQASVSSIDMYHDTGLISITEQVKKICLNSTLSRETGVSGNDVIHTGINRVCIRYRRCLAP